MLYFILSVDLEGFPIYIIIVFHFWALDLFAKTWVACPWVILNSNPIQRN